MGFSSVLIEPQGPDKSPSHISVARTFSSVNGDSCAIIQVMNTNLTRVYILIRIITSGVTPTSLIGHIRTLQLFLILI